jgi:hypothetical protein
LEQHSCSRIGQKGWNNAIAAAVSPSPSDSVDSEDEADERTLESDQTFHHIVFNESLDEQVAIAKSDTGAISPTLWKRQPS